MCNKRAPYYNPMVIGFYFLAAGVQFKSNVISALRAEANTIKYFATFIVPPPREQARDKQVNKYAVLFFVRLGLAGHNGVGFGRGVNPRSSGQCQWRVRTAPLALVQAGECYHAPLITHLCTRRWQTLGVVG